MAGKTQWEGHTRVPRTWLLDDGNTVQEPLLERTTGGRRVRSMEDKTLNGSHHEASNIAFTAAMRKAKRLGRIIVCESHTLADIRKRMSSYRFPDEPPMLHLTHDYYADHASSNGRLENDKTRFWTSWEHPTLPIHFISINGIETSYYYADTIQSFFHVPLFPGLGRDPDEELVGAPGTAEIVNGLTNQYSSNPILARTPAYWEGEEFWEHYPILPGKRIVEGRREALRLLLVEAMRINRMDTLEMPDLWSAVHESVDIDGKASWLRPPLIELNKTGSNIDDDTIESFKAYVTGADAAAKASVLYKQLRNELTHAGIVLGELSDDAFLHMLTNTTRPLTTTITGARNAAEGKTATRRAPSFTDQHSVAVDLVTGFVSVGCPHGDNPDAMPKIVQEAWDEAHTIASLSGKDGAFIEFATEYLRIKAENRVLTEALARRK